MQDSALLEKFLEITMTEKFGQNLEELQKAYYQEKDKVDQSFLKSFTNVFEKAIYLQKSKYKGPIGFIVISFLRTSIIENNFEYRIDLYDNSFYLDKVECSGYWNANFFFQYLNNDVEILQMIIREYIGKVKQYELEFFKKEYAASYNLLVNEYIIHNITSVIKTEEYKMIVKDQNIKILSGEYMDKLNLIYDGEEEKEDNIGEILSY